MATKIPNDLRRELNAIRAETGIHVIAWIDATCVSAMHGEQWAMDYLRRFVKLHRQHHSGMEAHRRLMAEHEVVQTTLDMDSEGM